MLGRGLFVLLMLVLGASLAWNSLHPLGNSCQVEFVRDSGRLKIAITCSGMDKFYALDVDQHVVNSGVPFTALRVDGPDPETGPVRHSGCTGRP